MLTAEEGDAERVAVLETVTRRALSAATEGCTLVAIDGVDGAGKSMFAAQLATCLRTGERPVIWASVDDFHHPRGVRYRRGRGSPVGYWLDSFDYSRLRQDLVDPLRPGGSRRYRCASHDLESDRVLDLPWKIAPPDAVLVLDGLFLHRDELAHLWDLSVFLVVPFAVSLARMAARDGTHPDPHHPSVARYVQGQRLYFDACSPWDRASLVIDNADWTRPKIVTAR